MKILLLNEGLTVFDDKTSPNYKFLYKALTEQSYDSNDELKSGARGVVLEGSSRSTKTWSGVDLIMYICTQLETRCTINIYRQTYSEFKTTLYDDFKTRLDDFGLPNPFHDAKEVKSFKIGKNNIFFLGDGKHGGGCDYAFYNEAMFIEKEVFDQSEMRCRKFWWMDYNPSFTEHWVFDSVIPRPDVWFLRTTFLDNHYLSPQERNKILSYEPWLPNSYEIRNNESLWYNGKLIDEQNYPPEHPTNIENGTADIFMWTVYGLGLRGAMEGVIFSNVNYINKFPEIAYTYGLDFGYTVDPSSLTRYAEDERNIWLELLLYKPTPTPEDLDIAFDAIGVERGLPITADSADKFTGQGKDTVEMVRGLRVLGWEVHKVSKKKGIMFGINNMRRKKIHIVKNHLVHHAKKEQENYRFKEVHGILINQPRDSYNHFWDSARYGHLGHSNNYSIHY